MAAKQQVQGCNPLLSHNNIFIVGGVFMIPCYHSPIIILLFYIAGQTGKRVDMLLSRELDYGTIGLLLALTTKRNV